MPTPWLLVHSPLLGPGCWRRLATAVEGRGRSTRTPDLTGFVDDGPPFGPAFVERAATGASGLDSVIVIGHSGAGAFLPAIGEALGPRAIELVFVDAIVPAADGAHRTPPDLRPLIEHQRQGDLLAPWPDWWPAEVMTDLVPDPTDRKLLFADAPRVPATLYDESIPLPTGWSTGRCRYVQLSPGYAEDRQRAESYGWPTAVIDGTHLAMFTSPDEVAAACGG